jgi:hypothetical protein
MLQYLLFRTATLPTLYLAAVRESFWELFLHLIITFFVIGLISTSGFVLYKKLHENSATNNHRNKEEIWFAEHWNEQIQNSIIHTTTSSTLLAASTTYENTSIYNASTSQVSASLTYVTETASSPLLASIDSGVKDNNNTKMPLRLSTNVYMIPHPVCLHQTFLNVLIISKGETK